MRLVDADEFEKRIKPYDTEDKVDKALYLFAHNKMMDTPTIDAVPVVRCKDCIHHEDEEPGMVYCPDQVGGWVSNDFFCKDGESNG